MIEIPYEFVLQGGLQEFMIFDQQFALEIPKGIYEGSYFQLNNVVDFSTNVCHTILVFVKYEEHHNYRREGNNLIGVFNYSK